MGPINIILCYAIVLLSFNGGIYAQENDTIPWEAGYKLSWEDFKAMPPANSSAAATTASGITYQFSTTYNDNQIILDYTVTTFFYPNKSWYRPALCDTIILSHEQLHFDISELFARQMRKELSSATFSKNVKAEVRAIYRKTLKALGAFQKRYDRETNFSRNHEQQLIWNKKIANALGQQ